MQLIESLCRLTKSFHGSRIQADHRASALLLGNFLFFPLEVLINSRREGTE